jgi:hypothetical protein
MTQEERADPRQTKDRVMASEKGRNAMTRREFMSTALGAGLFLAGAFAMSGCDGDGQPARGSISAPRKGGVAEISAGEKVKPKAAAGRKLRGKGAR